MTFGKCIGLSGLGACLLVFGCTSEVSRDNPFDPESRNPAPATISGVIEAPTRASLAGITVRLAGEEPPSPVTTDGDGAFQFGSVRPGRYNLEVSEQGFQHLFIYGMEVTVAAHVDLGTLVLVSLTETEEASLIRGFARLEGVDRHGGIQVRVVSRPFTALTDPEGEFQLVVPEGIHDLEFSFPDYEIVRLEGIAVDRATTLVLAEPIELPSDPATVAGVALRVTCASDPADETTEPADGAIASLLNTGHTGTVSPDGTFAVTGVPAGIYTLSVALPGHETQRLPGIALRGGQLLDLAEPFVLPASKGAISGRVLRSGDGDHSGTLVQVVGTGFMALTSADGSFRIPGVCAGEGFELSATYDGFVTGTRGGVRVDPGQTTQIGDLTLERQQGGFVLNGGSAFTGAADRVVTYRLEAAAGTTEMRLSEEAAQFTDPERNEEGWEAYVQDGTLVLSEGEGTKTVHAQVRGGGAVSGVLTATVVLDLTPPADPLVVIEDGGAYSNDADGAVLMTLTANELPAEGVDRVSGLASLAIYNHDLQAGGDPPASSEDPIWDDVIPVPYARTLQHPLLRPSVDEEKEVWVRFGDRAGNWSDPVSARVTLDRVPPEETSITIIGSAPGWANTASVQVALGAVDENPGLTMRIANDSTFVGAPWQPFLPEITWSLTPGDGTKRVWVEYMDAAGNASQALFDEVVLDTVAPTGIRLTIDEGEFTGTRDLGLTLAAQGATEMVFSRFRDFTDDAGDPMPWLPFDTAHAFELPDLDGLHTVYAKYRDAALNETEALWATVTLDRVPPVLSAVSILEGTHVAEPNVTLMVTAIADPRHAHEMQVEVVDVDSGASIDGTWVAFNPTTVVTLPAPAGEKRLDVRVRDAAGNVSDTVSTIVTYDPDPPVLHEVSLEGGATYTPRTEVTVTVDAEGADRMRVSNRGDYAGAAWQPFADAFAWNLPPGDGPHTVFVALRDLAGNVAEGQASIILDRTPPAALSVVLDEGATYSQTGIVDLVLSAIDTTSGLSEVELANEPGFNVSEILAWPAGEPSVSRASWTLLEGEGLRTVYARFRDVAGNVSESAGSILVDTTPPSGTVSIAGGATYATTRDVVLSFSASSDVVALAVADGAACDGAPWQAYATTLAWQLPEGDGPKTVTACFRDAAGNEGAASASIILDTTPPTGMVLIDDGGQFTTSAGVTLSLSASSDTQTMALVNGPSLDCATAVYEPYAEQRAWTLSAGDGEKWVSACFRDAAGLTGSASASIHLDTTPPSGTLVLGGGSTYTTELEIDVDLGFPADTDGYALADGTLDCRTASWEAVVVGTTSLGTSHALPAGDGFKTVVACFRDQAGNTASTAASIVLDTVPPAGTITINGGATHTTSRDVVLSFSAPSDATGLSVADGSSIDCESAAYQGWTTNLIWTLPEGDGPKAVSVCFRDAAGNTASAMAEIVLETTPPTGSIQIEGGATHTTRRNVTLDLTASSDTVLMALANGAGLDCATASYEPFSETRGWTLDSGDGTKTVTVCFKNAAGLVASASASIELDETPPVGTVVLDGGATYTTTTTVAVDLTFPSDTVGQALGDGHLDCSSATYIAVALGTTTASITHTVPEGDGSKTVVACFRDEAGNVASAADTIVLDTTPPVGTMAIDGGAAYATQAGVTLSFQVPGDTSDLKVVDGETIDCAAGAGWQAFTATLAWTLPAGDGLKWVSACFRDAAGNTASALASIVLDTTPPVGTVVIDGGASHATSTSVTLTLDAPADTDRMAIANGSTLDCGATAYEPFATQRPWTLSSGDGTKSVTVCFKDAAGLTAQASASIILDTMPPTGTISLAGGAAYTTEVTIGVELGFPNDTVGYALANDLLDCRTASYSAVTLGQTSASTSHALSTGDGTKIVVACFEDAAGHQASAADSIVLDTTPPTGTVTIAGGAAYTTTTSVTISLTAASDTVEMALAEGASIDCATVTWEAFSTTKSWVLGGEGSRTVWACFRDAAGLIGTASDVIVVDTEPPVGTLSINGADTHTQTTSVSIGLTASDDVVAMALVDGSAIDCQTAAFEPWSATRSWVLPSGDGTKVVTGCLKDAAGNTGTVQGSIILDTQPPSSATVAIDGGASWTTQLDVSLTFTTPEPVTLAVGNESLDCGSADYEAYESPKAWTLRDEDGLRTVVACFRDAAGWTVSRSASIGLDRVPPQGDITINGGAAYTTSRLVNLALPAPSDTIEMSLVNAATLDCATASYGPYAPTFAGWDLDPADDPANDGFKEVTVCFRDAAGLTASATAGIHLDRIDPSGTLLLAGGSTHVNHRSVLVEVRDASSDVTGLALAEGALDCGSATYGAFAPSQSFTLSDGDGSKTVVACLQDQAGRTTQLSAAITLDRQPPSGTLTLAGGAEWTTTRSIPLVVDSADAAEVALSNETIDCTAAVYVSMSGSYDVGSWTLHDADGLRTVRACLRDLAGNVTIVDDVIGLDRESPSRPIVRINDGATITDDPLVALTVTTSDNLAVTEMYLSRDGSFTDGSWEPYSPTVSSFSLTGAGCNASAQRTLRVRARDAAGNVSSTGSASIVLDCHPPTLSAVTIDSGASWTRSTGVQVSLTASDVSPGWLADMMLSEDPAFSGASWEPYVNPRSYVLTSGNGPKTLYVRVRDGSGRESGTESANIILDGQPPVVESFVVSNPESGFTAVPVIDLELTVYDNLSTGNEIQAVFSNVSLDCATATYTDTFPACPAGSSCTLSRPGWTIPDVEGTARIYACARDAAGNAIGTPVVAHVVHDKTDPPQVAGLVVVPGSRQIVASWGAVSDVGPSGLSHYDLAYAPAEDFSGGQIVAVEGTSAVLEDVQNRVEYWLRVRAVDRAGRTGPWSDVRRTTPGFRQVAVGDWNVDSGYRPATTETDVFYAEGNLYLTGVEEQTSTTHRITVMRCPVATADCHDPGNWVRTQRNTGRVVTTGHIPLVVTPERLYMATVEREGSNTHAPIVYTCDRANDCDAWWNWVAVQLETFSSDVRPTHVDLYADATRVHVAYYFTVASNDSRPTIASCPRTGACNVAGNWLRSQVNLTAGNPVSRHDITLAGNDTFTYVAWVGAQQIRVARCSMTSACGSWGVTHHIDGTDDGAFYYAPQMVATSGHLYATFSTTSSPRRQFMARCNLNTGCGATGSWTTTTFLSGNSVVESRQMVRLAYGNGALHASWWDQERGHVRYGWCADPDGQDCTNSDNWTLLVVDPWTARRTTPSVGAFGQNVGIAWIDDADRLRTSLPRVTSPLLDAVGPGIGAMRSNWSPMSYLGGYEQLYGPSAGPPWESRALLGDASIDRNEITASPGQDYFTSLRSYDRDNQVSDETAVTQVRPFRQAGPAATSIDSNTNCSSDLVTSGWNCGRYTTTSSGRLLLAAWSSGSDLYYGSCDTVIDDCSQSAAWNRVMVLDHAQGLYAEDIIVGDERVWISVQNSVSDTIVAWCSLSSGCRRASDFSWHRVVASGTDGYAGRLPRLAHGAGRIWVATSGSGSDYDIRVHHCATSTDCAVSSNWIKGVRVGTASDPGRGHSIAVGSVTAAVVRSDANRVRFHRCFVSGSTPCSTDSSFTAGASLPTAAPILENSLHLVMHGDNMPAFVGVWDGQAQFMSCPFYNSSCINSARWSGTSLGRVDLEEGVMTGLAHDGQSFYALYSSLDQIHLGTCTKNCSYPDGWHVVGAFRDVRLVEPWNNGRNLTVDPATGSITIGIGLHVTGRQVHFVHDGRMIREE